MSKLKNLALNKYKTMTIAQMKKITGGYGDGYDGGYDGLRPGENNCTDRKCNNNKSCRVKLHDGSIANGTCQSTGVFCACVVGSGY